MHARIFQELLTARGLASCVQSRRPWFFRLAQACSGTAKPPLAFGLRRIKTCVRALIIEGAIIMLSNNDRWRNIDVRVGTFNG
jgi:hypothetical protein